jgi:hypothetical protein
VASLDSDPVSLSEELRRPWSRRGVRRLTAPFDGYGDSGRIEVLDVQPEGVALDGRLRERVEEFQLDQWPGGGEIHAGRSGSLDGPAGGEPPAQRPGDAQGTAADGAPG